MLDKDIREPLFDFLEEFYGKIRIFEEKVTGISRTDALGVIEKMSKSREQITASTTPMGGAGGVYVPYPIRVTVGGATVFVLEVSQFLKV